MPFRCKKCHEHGHLIQECPLHKPTEKARDSSHKNQDGFFQPSSKHRENRRSHPKTGNPNKGSMNTFEVFGEEIAVEENTQTLAVEKEIPQKTEQNTQPSIPTSIDDLLLDLGFKKYAEGDEEMALTKIGTKDLDLSDILEKEGMDLNTIVEQWKQKGVDHIPEEEIERINFLFLSRQDATLRGQKRNLGATKGLGIKVQTLHHMHSSTKHKNKRGRRTNNEALQELGQMLINSGKMKALEAFPFSS